MRCTLCLVAVLCPLLGGCIRSKEPVLNTSNASYPFNTLVLKPSAEGEGIAVYTRAPDGYLEFDAKDRKLSGTFFVAQIGEDYVGQESQDNGYSYLFFRIEGNKLLAWDCDYYDEAALRAAGVIGESRDCIVHSVEDLKKIHALPRIDVKTLREIEIAYQD